MKDKYKSGSALVVAIIGGMLMLSLVTTMLLTSNQTFSLGLKMELNSQAYFTAISTIEFVAENMFCDDEGNNCCDEDCEDCCDLSCPPDCIECCMRCFVGTTAFGNTILNRLYRDSTPATTTDLFEIDFPADTNMGSANVFGRFEATPPQANHTPGGVNGRFYITATSDFAGYSYVTTMVVIASDFTDDSWFYPYTFTNGGQINANQQDIYGVNTHRAYRILPPGHSLGGAHIHFGSTEHEEIIIYVSANTTLSVGNAKLASTLDGGVGNNMTRRLYIILGEDAVLNFTHPQGHLGDGWNSTLTNGYRGDFDLYILSRNPERPGKILGNVDSKIHVVQLTEDLNPEDFDGLAPEVIDGMFDLNEIPSALIPVPPNPSLDSSFNPFNFLDQRRESVTLNRVRRGT